MQGVEVCYEHEVMLETYPVKPHDVSRIEFIRLDTELINHHECRPVKHKKLIDIAKAFTDIYHGKLNKFSVEQIKQAYLDKLSSKEFMSVNSSVKYKKFVPNMITFYGHTFLELVESEIELQTEFNWIKILLRGKERMVHPLRHILFILYFFESIDGLYKHLTSPTQVKNYPCMNPVCTHFKELVISEGDTIITADYKTREPVITLTCPVCSFKYSCKEAGDIFTVGRVKAFGEVWSRS